MTFAKKYPVNPPIIRYVPAVAEEIPLLVSIPHAGVFLSYELVQRLVPTMAGGKMTDWHLHELYSFLPQLGVDMVQATHHRFIVDLNRPPDAAPLYPGRFETGLVPLQTFQGEQIWSDPPTPQEIRERVEKFHKPYHEGLEKRLKEKVAQFGRCYLIDAHSVESRASLLHDALDEDVYLGNRDGTTCDPEFMNLVRDAFLAQGLKVSLNHPYKGGYTTSHYAKIEGVQTLQIEMCQRLYMQEGRFSRATAKKPFVQFKPVIRKVFEVITDAVRAPQLKC